jgi:hypothetical protein
MFLHTQYSDGADQQKPADPFKALRARQRPYALDNIAFAWMAQIPRAVQSRELGRLHPRIVNKLAQLWRSTLQVDIYLNELLVDNRPGRSGFSQAVKDELLVLRSHNKNRYTDQ